jgi:NADPH:quinone reductase-like Zn-dependent oxidoreductase
VTVNKADGPDAITVEDRSVREPRPGEVRLRVAAAAVNPVDVFMWRRAVEPPFTRGMDAAGTVESVGHAGGRLTVGEPIMAVVGPWLPEGGAQAELVVARAASVSPMPRYRPSATAARSRLCAAGTAARRPAGASPSSRSASATPCTTPPGCSTWQTTSHRAISSCASPAFTRPSAPSRPTT